MFLDLKKALDTVYHKIPLKMLYAYDIRDVALKLLGRVFSSIFQYVVYYYQQSETLSITGGVPQGSALGHLLFIKYIHNQCNISHFTTRMHIL